jgi:hypothetical protein
MGKTSNGYTILVGKFSGEVLGYNKKTDLGETICEDVKNFMD